MTATFKELPIDLREYFSSDITAEMLRVITRNAELATQENVPTAVFLQVQAKPWHVGCL